MQPLTKHILFIIILHLSTSFAAQQAKGIVVKLIRVPFPEKLIVKIHSDSLQLENIQFKMISAKGIVVKTVNFYDAKKDIDATILTEDVEFGEYTCIILKNTQQIHKEKFFKDFIYMDGGIPNIRNIDTTKKE